MFGCVLVLAGSLVGDGPEIVAHRGASHAAPENTLAAFRRAWELESDAIEGDFHLSRDGVIVCLHDGSLKKTAGLDRLVRDCDLDELEGLDVGSWKSEQYAGEPIPTLRAVLDTVPDGGTILIEIKTGPAIVPTLLSTLDAHPIRSEQVKVIAFDHEVIAAVEAERPELRTYWLSGLRVDDAGLAPPMDSLLRTLRACRADGLDVQASPRIDARFVQALRDEGLEFHVWTVNDRARARYFAGLGVDSITTDRPRWIREGLVDPGLPRPSWRCRMDGRLRFEGEGSPRAALLRGSSSGSPREVAGIWGGALDLRAQGARVRARLELPSVGTMGVWHRFGDSGRARLELSGPRSWRLDFDREGLRRWVEDGGEERRSRGPRIEPGWHWLWCSWDLAHGRRAMGVGAEASEWSQPSVEAGEASASWTLGSGDRRDGAYDEWTLDPRWWTPEQRLRWSEERPG